MMKQEMDDQNNSQEKNLREQVRERTAGYITAAFGLVAGLAWNDAVKALIELVFPAQRNSVLVKFIYAAVITIVVVMLTVYLARIFKKRT